MVVVKSKHKFYRSRIFGFTLIEVLISMFILVGIGAVGLTYLTGYRKNVDIDTEAEKIVSYLRQVQSRARSGESGVAWGVHFVNNASDRDYYQMFSGSIYYSTTTVETIYVSAVIDFTNPSSGNVKDIVFQRISGLPAASSSVTIASKNDATKTKTISINQMGVLDY